MLQFEELYAEYWEPIYRHTWRLLGLPEQAEDAAQEAFLRLYHKLNAEEELNHPRAYLYRIATNLCYNQLRRQKKLRDIIAESGRIQSHDGSPEKELFRKESAALIRRALEKLSRRDRLLLQLYDDGLSYSEISDITGIKKTSVGKLLSRAVERCARLIEE